MDSTTKRLAWNNTNSADIMSFVGVTVQLTLKQPPNTVLQGKVEAVVAGQNITLESGEICDSPLTINVLS